ncbi:MAG: hypothetical protein DRP11_05370 [Candidatus Aenigmatarchaeota archaeon]|nr:MAG: hypothetical protein DRP11_05370 [Candidatus Aenigmarchaeota archaeon]
MSGEDEQIKLLREIKEALKQVEGYFIYTSTSYTTAVENLLDKYPCRYIKSDTLMADLYEYIIICKDHVWQEIRDRISQSGFKAYCSNTRLPVSGTIGTINAVVEKAQVYGYDDAASDWKAIYETANALHVRLKAEDVGLPQSSGTVEAFTVTVGTTKVQVTSNAHKARKIVLQAAKGNSGKISIGNSTNQVHELSAGEKVELNDVNVNELYAIADSASQVLNVLYVR